MSDGEDEERSHVLSGLAIGILPVTVDGWSGIPGLVVVVGIKDVNVGSSKARTVLRL